MLTPLAVAIPAEAREPLVTDRPDVAESSQALSVGGYQLEQAGQLESDAGAASLGFPSLHRVGVGNGLELRLETPIASLSPAGALAEDLAIGAKWQFLDGGEPGQAPSVALLGHAIFDRAGGVSPLLKLLADASLPLGFDLGVNLGATLPAGPLALGPAFPFAAAIAHPIDDRLRAYGEVSGELAALGPAQLGVDGGFAFLATDDLQLDVALYRGLTPNAPAWYLTTGVSLRWTP